MNCLKLMLATNNLMIKFVATFKIFVENKKGQSPTLHYIFTHLILTRGLDQFNKIMDNF